MKVSHLRYWLVSTVYIIYYSPRLPQQQQQPPANQLLSSSSSYCFFRRRPLQPARTRPPPPPPPRRPKRQPRGKLRPRRRGYIHHATSHVSTFETNGLKANYFQARRFKPKALKFQQRVDFLINVNLVPGVIIMYVNLHRLRALPRRRRS